MQENICKTHFSEIISKGENNQDQCEVCHKNELFNKMLTIEKIIKISQHILNQSKNNHETQEIVKTRLLINKYKAHLPQSFAKRKSQYKYEMLQARKYNKFNYKLVSEFSDYLGYHPFVFNQNSTLLFIGDRYHINVYKFENGEIKKQLQNLTYHENDVCFLIFLNKSNLLVSGSEDKPIVIWNQDEIMGWEPYLILKGSQGEIACLIHNEDENLIISSDDDTIKFWRKMNMNWSCQQTMNIRFDQTRLSLSKSQKKLIICGRNYKNILVVEQKRNQKWGIQQKIDTNNEGYNLIFISDSEFVYQDKFNYLEIYLYDQNKKLFIKNKQIDIEIHKEHYLFDYPLFPCKYIEQKNILIIPYGPQLNCFRIDQKQNYILQQSIDYQRDVYGNISNNGQYIITWLSFSHKIQVRELQYLE